VQTLSFCPILPTASPHLPLPSVHGLSGPFARSAPESFLSLAIPGSPWLCAWLCLAGYALLGYAWLFLSGYALLGMPGSSFQAMPCWVCPAIPCWVCLAVPGAVPKPLGSVEGSFAPESSGVWTKQARDWEETDVARWMS